MAILFLWGLFCFIGFRWVVSDLQSGQVFEHSIADKAFQQHLKRIKPIFFVSLGCLILVSSLFAVRLSKDLTKPVVRLTGLADEISQGNLDVDIAFGQHVNCWEIKHCRKNECAAYENREVQCWFVDGTPCEGYEPRFPQKLGQCRQCEVYHAHRGDEIVQLADSFKHMAYKLKTSQKDLKGAYNLQKCLIENSFDGIIASDMNGVILIFNRVAEQLTGFQDDEVVGKKTWRNFFYPDLLEEIHKPLLDDGSTVLQGFPPRESVIFRRDGNLVPVWVGGVSLTVKEQDVGRVVFFHDIREVKRLRQNLIDSERMAAVGQTVASISHSIKNILDGLRGGVYVHQHGQELNDQEKKNLGWEMIHKNIDIISELVIDLLNYSKDRQLEFQRYSPNKLTREVCMIMERKAESRNIQLIHREDDQTKEAIFDPYAMHQCLLNIVSNAIDAIPPDRQGRVEVTTFRDGENRLCFKVLDNGVGMNREIKDKILKGMFSTKGSKGTGLGLLVVQKIIQEHQGKLEIDSKKGEGSEFLVSLPYLASTFPA
jgi:PAS domain S-box-containing protein